MPDLLIELGTEEIPAAYLQPALKAWKKELEVALEAHQLQATSVTVTGTPRRLVLHASGLPEAQASRAVEVSGPPKAAAFGASGQPTPVAEGFARKQGIAVSDIQFRTTPKGEYCFAVRRVQGRRAIEILSEVAVSILPRLPFPKSMYWRERGQKFARPLRSVAALFGEEVVPFTWNGISSGRESHGHPFLAPGPLPLPSADFEDYCRQLEARKVIVSIEKRRAAIERQIEKILNLYGSKHNQAELVEEVTNLVEWPHALEGQFPQKFLEVPPEVVETAMMEHQRYFPIHDAQGKLLNRFVVVSNRDGAHDSLVRAGNERVLRARLADALFFWQEDRKTRLVDRVESLKSVLYQIKIGSYYDRTSRVSAMADFVGRRLGLPEEQQKKLGRAALLSKTDLLTQMVYEFPSLQGVMGREYALRDGEDREVALAIEEHYRPRQAGGPLPDSPLGTLLALAEKVDTVSACFAARLAPTAAQDPYGLRRQTLGIIRLIVEKKLSISLTQLFEHGLSLLPSSLRADPALPAEILKFVRERLYNFCIEQGCRYDLVNAALATGFDDLLDFWARMEALARLSVLPEWPALVEVVERTYKITRGSVLQGNLQESLLQEEAERSVFQAYQRHHSEIEELFRKGDYFEAAQHYHAVFARIVHEFFDKVFVNVENLEVRTNRLLLMQAVHRLFADRMANLVQVVMSGRA